jgi:transposase
VRPNQSSRRARPALNSAREGRGLLVQTDWDIKLLHVDPRASSSFRRLVEAGSKADELENHLKQAVVAYKFPRRFDPLAVPGMSRKRIERFPDELRLVACGVEMVNEHPFFGESEGIDQKAKLLARSLRSYADYCQETIRSFRSGMKTNPRHFDMQSIFRRKLLQYVYSSTGDWHYQWVADVLDPFFVEKVRDIVGLYLNPPENAVVLCVDEKSQIQALERTQPMLPMGLGYVEGVTHDYRRHGTTTLFAALDTTKGKVLTQCRPRHRHQEYLGFLREIEKNVAETLDVHIIVDNYATHKHPRVKRWLAARPRFHVHFTPTYASWLNQVEIWFNRITQQAIRRGTFRSVKELVEKIDHYVQNSNNHAQPFVWTATADSIFAKVQRLCERISGTGH